MTILLRVNVKAYCFDLKDPKRSEERG